MEGLIILKAAWQKPEKFMARGGGSAGKEPACNAGDTGDADSIPGQGSPPGGGQPTPAFLPGESHGQRGLADYSSQGHIEPDTTEATEHTLLRWTGHARAHVSTGEHTRSVPVPSELMPVNEG